MALPVDLLAVRHTGRARRFMETQHRTWCGRAGLVVIAWPCPTLTSVNGRILLPAPMMILAYAISLFPLALVGVRLRWPGPGQPG